MTMSAFPRQFLFLVQGTGPSPSSNPTRSVPGPFLLLRRKCTSLPEYPSSQANR